MKFQSINLTYAHGSAGSNNGQISGITDGVDNGRTVNYGYDPLARLSTALTVGSANHSQWGLSMSYDRYGNRTAQTVTAGTGPSNSVGVDATTNRIVGLGYDANGNMTNDGSNTLVYDAENRVLSATNASTSGTYTYDGNGLRVTKASGSTTTIYIFSGSKVIAEYDNGAVVGSPSREYIYAGGALLAKIDSSGTKYYHQDHLSNRLVTDSGGNTSAQLGHFPFGEAWYNGTNDKLLFTTYERDGESGNDYALARYNVNRLGRFSSADPLGGSNADPQSLNRYSYVRNRPISFVDPSGMDCEDNIDEPCQSGPIAPTEDFGICEQFGICRATAPDLPFPVDRSRSGVDIGALVKSAIAKALEALKNQTCRGLFGENVDPSALLESLANDSVLGTIQAGPISNPAISAQTSPNLGAYFSYKGNGKFVGPISTFTGATITVNSNPAASFSAGYPGPSSLGFDPSTSHAITVIHELGHAANFTYGSGASVIANDGPTGVGAQLSRINTILVANNCFGGPR